MGFRAADSNDLFSKGAVELDALAVGGLGIGKDQVMKKAIWLGMIVGSVFGGWLPVQFGADGFSMASLVGSTIGGMLGVYAGWWLVKRVTG